MSMSKNYFLLQLDMRSDHNYGIINSLKFTLQTTPIMYIYIYIHIQYIYIYIYTYK